MPMTDLTAIDLFATECPLGLTVEIEGKGKLEVEIPRINLITGIAHVLVIFTGKQIFPDKEFASRITLLECDEKRKFIKVRIAPK